MYKCVNIQKSVGWCQGTPEYAGMYSRVYFISKQSILAYPQLPKDDKGRVTSAVLIGNFTLDADATWKYIDINTNKSQATSEPQGELPSQTQINKLLVVHNGTGHEASGLAASLNNSDNIFIHRDMKGQYRVTGCEKWPVKTTVAQDQGQGAAGATSTTITAEASDEVIFPIYSGDIVTDDGVIDCSDGSLINRGDDEP